MKESRDNPLFAFFGTGKLSVCVLDALEKNNFLPALVISAPDKPQGRHLTLTPPPAKVWALERGIDVLQPTTLKDESILAELTNTDWDLFIVAMYGKLIPQDILDLPRRGALNVHPSLLPKFRGPSPVLSAILQDVRETGVSIMQMSAEMDAGPVLTQARIEIDENDWPPSGSMLEMLLTTEGGNLLAETIPHWLAEKMSPEPQDNSIATYTKKFLDEDARIDLSLDANAREQFLKIRAFDQSPRAHFFADLNGKKIRVIATGVNWKDNQLEIKRVIPEGKKEMSYSDFLRSGAKPIFE